MQTPVAGEAAIRSGVGVGAKIKHLSIMPGMDTGALTDRDQQGVGRSQSVSRFSPSTTLSAALLCDHMPSGTIYRGVMLAGGRGDVKPGGTGVGA
jgi:hypothetical protein